MIANWRVAGWVGVTGMLGSLGWFSAMTLQNVGHMTAIPLMASLLIGTFAAVSLILSAEEQERDNPETDQHDT